VTAATGETKVALITGASSGLGAALARQWRQAGFRVVAVSRRPPEADVADDFIAADLGNPGAAKALFEEFRRRETRLDVLINNAGIGAYAGWEELPEADWRRLMEIDLFAPVELTRLALGMLRESRGTVVNISSVAGLVPVPGMGAYSAAKFALLAFSESLGAEMRRTGVRTLTVCPGRIRTGFSQRSVTVRPAPETPGSGASSAEELARRVRRAAERGRRRVVYPRWYVLFVWFARCFPRFYEKKAAELWHFD